MNNDNTDYVSNESGTLSRLFKLPQHGTTVRTELIAGMTTFLTMVYIVFVNPQILGAAQMDPKVVFVTTCLIAGIGSIAMGVFANLPVALAPAMGLNAFFAFVVVGAMGISWQTGMGAIFWGAVGLFLLTLFRIRYWMISNIPLSLRIGITSGIGLFIALMGLKNTGVIVANKDTGDDWRFKFSRRVVRYFRVFYYNRVVITSFSCRGACFYCGDVLLWIVFRRCSF